MKKTFSLLLAALMLFCCAVPAFAAADDAQAFVPTFRFVAASDTHVRDDDDTNVQRIEKMMRMAYDVAEADPTYTGLDALLIAGDLTNDGTKTEFDKFWNAVDGSLRDGTRFLGVVAKNHDGYEMKRAELRGNYKNLTGNDADFHVVIGGYHFIGVSASSKDGIHYDAGQIRWLKAQLDAAVAEDPAKPVFVTHHEHVRGTVYGSSLYDGWGVTYFTSVLNKYPQVVDFSGHSHYPLNDPRSVWQGKFTAVGTGAIYYSEFTVDATRTYHPADSGATATCWIVELDAENNVRLRGYDINEAKLLCGLVLKNPADPANREYTPAKRRAAARAPVFDADAALFIEEDFGGCRVAVPAAKSADGMPVVLYRYTVKDGRGVTVAKDWVMPSYYRAVQQDTVTLTLEDLPAGEYEICVLPENAYGMQSAPLQAFVSVKGETGVRGFIARIALWFRNLKTFFTKLFG